ncbi:TPA: hypothetical protein HA219_03145 [Candidatus Woesearchaeota archaeon]|nr:hypothetical protein [Candidatus Woesearchaeota archaeon]HIH39689.1 hypothetical protein [Candidatus Woesearchaeota archaeon]
MLTLEQIKKLPAKERIPKLREFEEEQKKLKAEEEKKRKQEEEEIIKKSIEELTEEDEKAEEEEVLQKEEKEKKQKQESLEEIAEAAPSSGKTERNSAYVSIQEYGARLSHIPPTELSNKIFGLRETFEERSYLTQEQQRERDALGEAVYQQNKMGYFKDEGSRRLFSKMEDAFEEMRNPLKKVYK